MARQAGGPVEAARSYLVGERGPELYLARRPSLAPLTPASAGTVRAAPAPVAAPSAAGSRGDPDNFGPCVQVFMQPPAGEPIARAQVWGRAAGSAAEQQWRKQRRRRVG